MFLSLHPQGALKHWASHTSETCLKSYNIHEAERLNHPSKLFRSREQSGSLFHVILLTAEKEATTSESKVSMADLIKERDQV